LHTLADGADSYNTRLFLIAKRALHRRMRAVS
jgi:hypothetical protein